MVTLRRVSPRTHESRAQVVVRPHSAQYHILMPARCARCRWIPCNVLGLSSLEITIAPAQGGGAYRRGYLRLTHLSVEHADFERRGLEAVALWPSDTAKWPSMTAGPGSDAVLACPPPAPPASGSAQEVAECPAGYGDSKIDMAFDGRDDTGALPSRTCRGACATQAGRLGLTRLVHIYAGGGDGCARA